MGQKVFQYILNIQIGIWPFESFLTIFNILKARTESETDFALRNKGTPFVLPTMF